MIERATVLSSEVVYQGPLFRVLHDKLVEPGGRENERDVIRHNGSVVILAIDNSKSKKNPWIVMERQYRHAANQFLWELPAGKIDAGEEPLAGAKRELAEETGYRAKKWRPLVEYYASPGFLGEAMKVFLAEGLEAGDTHWEEDEEIELRLVKLTDVLKMIEKGRDSGRQNIDQRAVVRMAAGPTAEEVTAALTSVFHRFGALFAAAARIVPFHFVESIQKESTFRCLPAS